MQRLAGVLFVVAALLGLAAWAQWTRADRAARALAEARRVADEQAARAAELLVREHATRRQLEAEVARRTELQREVERARRRLEAAKAGGPATVREVAEVRSEPIEISLPTSPSCTGPASSDSTLPTPRAPTEGAGPPFTTWDLEVRLEAARLELESGASVWTGTFAVHRIAPPPRLTLGRAPVRVDLSQWLAAPPAPRPREPRLTWAGVAFGPGGWGIAGGIIGRPIGRQRLRIRPAIHASWVPGSGSIIATGVAWYW